MEDTSSNAETNPKSAGESWDTSMGHEKDRFDEFPGQEQGLTRFYGYLPISVFINSQSLTELIISEREGNLFSVLIAQFCSSIVSENTTKRFTCKSICLSIVYCLGLGPLALEESILNVTKVPAYKGLNLHLSWQTLKLDP